MDLKYRIKRPLNSNDPQKSHSAIGSPIKSKSSHKLIRRQSDDKRFKSQIIKPTYVPTPTKRKPKQQSPVLYTMKTFSKQNIRTTSPQIRKEDITLSRIPQSQSLHSSIQLKSPSSHTPKQPSPSLNIVQQMSKFPHYVSKSHMMIQTKKKLLQAKHNIKLGRDCPILQTIQDSVNEDKTAFSRKMKLQLCRKGNYDLIGYLYRDVDEVPTPTSAGNYRGRNLPYLLMNQYKDPYTLEKQERVQKMEEIKRNLKKVRKNNLSSLSRKTQA